MGGLSRFEIEWAGIASNQQVQSQGSESGQTQSTDEKSPNLAIGALNWCRHQESNSGPSDYKSAALPTELYRLGVAVLLFLYPLSSCGFLLVPAPRVELGTF